MQPARNQLSVQSDIIDSLAETLHCPVDVVEKVYVEEFEALKATARLPDYVALFAARRTRERIGKAPRPSRRRGVR